MIRIGSRGSDLALWQARYVRTHLDGESEIIVIKTKGDKIQHLTLDKVEGKGFFTKEIESALIGKDEGDSVDVRTPGGVRSYEILSITYM